MVLSVPEMGGTAPPVFTSVGRNGVNAPGDVFIIQSLLNDRLPKPHAPIPVNGIADVGMTLAIETYQASILLMLPPSGRVDPGSPTYNALAASPMVEGSSPPPATGHFGEVAERCGRRRHRFTQEMDSAGLGHRRAVGSGERLGRRHAARHQQPVRHQGGGRPACGGKLEPAKQSTARTFTITARFRAFDLLTQAFDEHGRLLATASVYKEAMRQVDNPKAFADALTGVYATGSELRLNFEMGYRDLRPEPVRSLAKVPAKGRASE